MTDKKHRGASLQQPSYMYQFVQCARYVKM